MSDKFSFAHFVTLHGLTQLLSSSSSRFVLASSVSSDAWTVHIGLAGDGRWWEGYWSEEDVLAIGQNNSAKHLKAFAQRLESTIVKGEIGLSGWDPSVSRVEDMQFVINPNSKKPLRIALREMSAKEAARFTVKHLVSVAEEARAHGCRLFGSASTSTTPVASSSTSFKRPRTPTPPRPSAPSRSPSPAPKRHSKSLFRTQTKKDPFASSSPAPEERPAKKPKLASRPTLNASKSSSKASSSDLAAQTEIEQLRRELARARSLHEKAEQEHRERERDLMQEKAAGGSTDLLRSRTLVPAAQRRPGASLANPNQKARRYQAVEFEDDSD
ncbi:hypothetical protein OF83DRAFT_450721 [Amylostereum chailletii]|nr:hypothetical protein OF83DRAFT_450721 [Amylostereum chailletii]